MAFYFYAINHDQGLIYIFLRAVLLLIFCTLLLRFGNRRFSLNNSFDLIAMVIFGGLISRGINGSASLISTLVALIGIIATHKTIAVLSCRFHWIEYLFKGQTYLLIKDGVLQKQTLKKLNITEDDLKEQMRPQVNRGSYARVTEAYLERTGNISFVVADKK